MSRGDETPPRSGRSWQRRRVSLSCR